MPHAPKHLQLKTRQWWMDVVKTHKLTDPQRHILTLAGEAWDRSAQARRVLERDGLMQELTSTGSRGSTGSRKLTLTVRPWAF